MPKKNNPGVFQRLSRLRARARQMKIEITRLAGAVAERNGNPAARDLKLQLSQARATLSELEDYLTPLPSHIDVPFGAAAPAPTPVG